MSAVHYTLPKNRVLFWLVAPMQEVPDAVQYNLIAHFFTAILPVFMGAVSVLIFNIIAYVRHPDALFFLLLLTDCLLFVVRFSTLLMSNWLVKRRRDTPTDLVLVLGLAWCAHVGVGNALCFFYNDNALSILSIANMLGVAAVLVVRNHGCPRLAIVQILVCTLPFSFILPFCRDRILLVFLVFMPIYLLGMVSAILKLHGSYLKALLSDYENKRLASCDFLTNLKNRNGFFSEFSDRLQCIDQSGSLALFYLDLDGFKAINDTLGHAAGDDLLRQVAERLVAIAPRDSIIARLGGDEFVIVASGHTNVDAIALGQTIVAAIRRPYELGIVDEARVGISIGVALTTSPVSPDTLMASADRALYRAKAGGKGRVVLAEDQAPLEQCVA